jgi:hypothetical protein
VISWFLYFDLKWVNLYRYPEDAAAAAAADRDAKAARWARAKNALEVLASDPGRYALDDATRGEVHAALNDANGWLAGAAAGVAAGVGAAAGAGAVGGGGGVRGRAGAGAQRAQLALAAAAFVAGDPRSARAGPLLAAMPGEGEKSVHRLGFFTPVGGEDVDVDNTAAARDDGGAPFCAVVHEKGRPRWGPARATRAEAAGDRKEMRRAVKEGALDAVLRRWRERVLPHT